MNGNGNGDVGGCGSVVIWTTLPVFSTTKMLMPSAEKAIP